MTLAFFVLIQYRSVTDGQTDIPSLAIPAVCKARYANALVKIRHDAKFRILSSSCCSQSLIVVGWEMENTTTTTTANNNNNNNNVRSRWGSVHGSKTKWAPTCKRKMFSFRLGRAAAGFLLLLERSAHSDHTPCICRYYTISLSPAGFERDRHWPCIRLMEALDT